MAAFGVYILTYPGDYHLAIGLIASLRRFHPELPIVIIPGEGVDRRDHPFRVPLMPRPEGFWGELGFIDRKFWAFQGPFERFLYLDADILCTRPLDAFIARIRAASPPFVFAHLAVPDREWHDAVHDPADPRHGAFRYRVANQLGDPARLARFDPGFDPYARYPFNAGIFGSAREAIPEAAFRALHERETAFYAQRLRRPFSWRARELFYRDQGRLNYLVRTLNIPVEDTRPDGNDVWGGLPVVLTAGQLGARELDFTFIHWAGVPAPSPSLFCSGPLFSLLRRTYRCADGYSRLKEVPGYSAWRALIEAHEPELLRWPQRLRGSLRDLRRMKRHLWRLRRGRRPADAPHRPATVPGGAPAPSSKSGTRNRTHAPDA